MLIDKKNIWIKITIYTGQILNYATGSQKVVHEIFIKIKMMDGGDSYIHK